MGPVDAVPRPLSGAAGLGWLGLVVGVGGGMPRGPQPTRVASPPYRVPDGEGVGPGWIIESRMAKEWVEEKYADRAAWVEGFAKTFQDLAHEGILSKCIRSMPQRLKDVVAARGGPTKW